MVNKLKYWIKRIVWMPVCILLLLWFVSAFCLFIGFYYYTKWDKTVDLPFTSLGCSVQGVIQDATIQSGGKPFMEVELDEGTKYYFLKDTGEYNLIRMAEALHQGKEIEIRYYPIWSDGIYQNQIIFISDAEKTHLTLECGKDLYLETIKELILKSFYWGITGCIIAYFLVFVLLIRRRHWQ